MECFCLLVRAAILKSLLGEIEGIESIDKVDSLQAIQQEILGYKVLLGSTT